MKQLKHLLAALVFVSLIIFTNCGPDGDPKPKEPEDVQGEKLAATWSVTANGAKLESQVVDGWDDFELSITYDASTNDGTYTTTNSGSTVVWPASGTWEFDGEDIGTVLRSDDVEISISAINTTGTSLTLAFTITSGGARTSSVNGNWTFSFTSPA